MLPYETPTEPALVNPPAETPAAEANLPLAQRLKHLGVAAVGAYGMHRGLNAEIIGNEPAEHLGNPLAELTVIPATLAVTALRTEVLGARIRRAERGAHNAEKRERRSARDVTKAKDNFQHIMKGKGGVSVEHEMVEPTLTDKIVRLGKKLRHPTKKIEHDPHRATVSRREQRDNMRMNVRRDKRSILEIESRWMDERFSKDVDHGSGKHARSFGKRTSDLGTELGWKRFYAQAPRTRAEVRGYKSAIKTKHHADHRSHQITENTEAIMVGVPELMTKVHRYAKNRHTRKAEKLQDRRDAVMAREDRASRAYDKTKTGVAKVAVGVGRGAARVKNKLRRTP